MVGPTSIAFFLGGFILGFLIGLYILKRKIVNSVPSGELNPAEMVDQAQDMIEDFSDGDMELETPHEDRKPEDADTKEQLEDILGDDKDE